MIEHAGRRSRGLDRERDLGAATAANSWTPFALVKGTLVTAGVLASLVAVWILRDLLLILFGAIVMAIGLRGSVTYLAFRLRVRRQGAFVVIVAALGIVAALVAWLFGPDIAANVAVVSDQLPQSLEQAVAWLNDRPWGHRLLKGWEAEPGLSQIPQLLDLTRVTFTVAASAIVMLIAAIYLALNPEDYRRLALDCVPKRQRLVTWQILRAIEGAIQRWLAGQAAAIAFTAIGISGVLWTLKVPLGGTVAFVAAMMTLVPFLGAIAGGALVTLMAFTNGVQTAAYAAGSWLAIHAISEYGLLPQFQRWSVNVPPVASIFMAVAWGSLFGFHGLLLAGPLTVTVIAAGRALRDGS